MDEMDLMWIPVHRSWRLNERHYGSLQGLNKRDTVEKYGQEQVQIWRRSYEIQPPALDKTDKRNPVFEPRYAQLKNEGLPSTKYLIIVNYFKINGYTFFKLSYFFICNL